jgi:hypothetical protein
MDGDLLGGSSNEHYRWAGVNFQVVCHVKLVVESMSILDQLLARLEEELRRVRPMKIVLGLPAITSRGKIMNFELANDTVANIPIHTTNSAGVVVPAPSGDVFSVASSDSTKLKAEIGTMPPGASVQGVALVLTPLVQAFPGLSVIISDTSALTSDTQIVDIVADLTPKAITLDLADAVLTPQAIPPA